MNINIITFLGGYPSWYNHMVCRNRQMYCDYHNYTNTCEMSNESGFNTKYNKILLLQKTFTKYDWQLYLDADIFILDIHRPITEFVVKNYSLILPGEEMTKFSKRYQFSAYALLFKSDENSQKIIKLWKNILKWTSKNCNSPHVYDQLPLRNSISMFLSKKYLNRDRCRHSCSLSCLDSTMFSIRSSINKGKKSLTPIYFHDISIDDTGLALQTKQNTYQWSGDKFNDDRNNWLPYLQKAISNSFSVHWNFKNPFDFDNYILYYTRAHNMYIPDYRYPDGCTPGSGQTPKCCGYHESQRYKGCISYGKKMNDW